MRDPVYSDSVATSGGPHGLEFLGTGGQGARDTVPVPRIRGSVLSWESLECTRVHSLKSFTMGMGWQCALHTALPAPQSHKLNNWSHSVGHSLVSGHPLQQWAAAIRSNLGLTIQAQLLVRSSPPGGAQPRVHGRKSTDCGSPWILPEWQCEGRGHFLLFLAVSWAVNHHHSWGMGFYAAG